MIILRHLLVFIWMGILFSWGLTQTETAALDPESAPDYSVLVDAGFGVGWPGYQLYHVNVGLQKDRFGVAFRGALTEVGPYLSASARYYTPIPIPVPSFVSLGVGVLGYRPLFTASLGAHIPLYGPNLRLTLEAGASYQTVFDQRQILPYVALGLSYAFVVDTAPISQEERARRELERSRPPNCEPTEPDVARLDSALSRAVQREVRQAKASYAGVYKNMDYSYSVKEKEIGENRARITASYRASATQVLDGKRISGSGTIVVRMRWNGCDWSLGGYSFED